jgi:ribonuclease D
MKIHSLITTTDALAALCERLAKSDFVTVDTEFMRENTYWPELCLVQIANTEEAAASIRSRRDRPFPLLDLLVDNEEVLKVFHAGGQDVEIIYNLTGKTPHPIFDTQIAMMAVSQSEQIGYSNLVESWLGLSIDKGARFTDWSRRPLTERQIEYAIGDVTHLSKIFQAAQAPDQDRARRMARHRDGKAGGPGQLQVRSADRVAEDPPPSRNPAVLGRMRAIAAWREAEAMDKNIPRGRIMRDETLADIASHPRASSTNSPRCAGFRADGRTTRSAAA